MMGTIETEHTYISHIGALNKTAPNSELGSTRSPICHELTPCSQALCI